MGTVTEVRDLTCDALTIAGRVRELSRHVEHQTDRLLAAEVRKVALRLEEMADYFEEVAR
jgi:hypothetical protein